ncbi:MAG: Mur ligase family protein, partial [Clostridia bacterium]
MDIFISGIISYILSVVSVYSSYAFLKAFQQRGYKKTGYLRWLYKDNGKYTSRRLNVTLFSVFSYILFLTLFGVFNFPLVSYLAFAFFVIFSVIYGHSQRKNERQKLDRTSRMKRLEATLVVVNFGVYWGLISLFGYIMEANPISLWNYIGYSGVCLLTIVFPFFVIISDWIMFPIEHLRREHYKKLALAKLSKNKDVINIGITGSFGKTTVKNILGTILAEKYSVLITANSYNTPMGISKSLIDSYVSQDIFVCEMGARRKGEIKELAEFIPCKIGVITSVSRQHLEGFKTLENILDTKFELVENLLPNGAMFFSGDNDGSIKLFDRAKCEKHMTSVNSEKEGISVTNIEVTKQGSKFTLKIGESTREVSTKLLGKHNISNI